MFTKILRLLSSNKRPDPLWHNIINISQSNSSPEKVEQLIKSYKDLYSRSQTDYTEHIWKNDKKLQASLESISGLLDSISSSAIIELIKALSLFSITNHSIWTTLEQIFISKSINELDPKDLPYMIKGFSLPLSKNERLWEELSGQMLNYLNFEQIKVDELVMAYIGFSRCKMGSQELIDTLENQIILNLNHLKGPQYIDLYIGISSQVVGENKLSILFMIKSLEKLNECELDDLAKLHMALIFYKEKYELTQMVENSILKGFDKINLKQISTIMYKYNSPYFKKWKKISSFPRSLIDLYVDKRYELISKLNSRNLQAVYEIKILSTAIALGEKIPDNFARAVYNDIARNNLQFGSKIQLQHSYLLIQNYMKLIN